MLPRILWDSRAFMLRDLADAILTQLRSLWLRLTVTKSDLSPSQMMTFLGMVWDSTSMQEWQSPAWVESILSTVKDFRLGQEISVCQYQKLFGLMAATANVISLGFLYTRSFCGSYAEGPTWCPAPLRGQGFHSFFYVEETPVFHHGFHTGCMACYCCKTVTTDTSPSIFFIAQPGFVWDSPHLLWHINCLEIKAVFMTLRYILPVLRG